MLDHTGFLRTLALNKKNQIKTAVSYAKAELEARIDAGEKYGLDLANSYHTVGLTQAVALKESIIYGKKQEDDYNVAKSNLDEAMELAKNANNMQVVSVINLRMAWLEMSPFNPERDETMEKLMYAVFEAQEQPASKWGPALRQELKPQMSDVCHKLGGTYLQKYKRMYQA